MTEAVAERRLERAEEERTLAGLIRYFAKLGSWGFGGPIALAGYMHRDLVEGKRWYTEDECQQGLAISQAMPGPLAAQLAMWLGYLERGWKGALAVALPFVVPPFLIVTAVAVLYAHYQGLSLVQDLFFGVAPAVLAIVAIASYRLARRRTSVTPSCGESRPSSASLLSSPGRRSFGRSSPPRSSARSTTAAACRAFAARPASRRSRWSPPSKASPGSVPAPRSGR